MHYFTKKFKEYIVKKNYNVPVISDADPDPAGSESFGRIWIRSNCPVPDPALKTKKSKNIKVN